VRSIDFKNLADFYGLYILKKKPMSKKLNFIIITIENYRPTVLNGKNESEKAQILSDLLEYCEMDTYAMVEIYRKLNSLIQ